MSVDEQPRGTAAEPEPDEDEGTTANDDPAFAALLARLAAPPRRERPLLAPGSRVGPFVVEELLGRGGMGEVWRATDTQLQRTVALKVLRRSSNELALLDEARAAAAVHHARVATIYQVGEADGPTGRLGYIALELVPGATLRARLRDGPLPPAQALPLALDVAEGLAAVHARGLIHRDVKPDNLALDAGGRVKVLDFGIATRAGADAAGYGTPRYLAPEQRVEGAVEACADVYAFGVTLIELLTGSAPFDDDGALVPELHGDPLARVRTLPALPRALLELLARCVATDRAMRPANAAVLVDALAPLVHARPSARERAAPWITLGVGAALTAAFFSSVTRVEDVVAADLPPALASAPVVSDDARVRARFRAAADAMLAGDDATAATALAEVTEAEPAAAWPWALLVVTGEAARAGSSHQAALAEVRRLADRSTRAGRAALALAELADARSLASTQPIPPHAQAVAVGMAALTEAGADHFSAVLLASLLPWHHGVQEQLDRIDAALSRDVRIARLWVARSDALTAAGRPAEGALAARAGLERVPGNGALEDALWRARIAQGELDEAERALGERLRARPDDLGARLLLLDVTRARGDEAALWRAATALLDGPYPRAPVARAAARLALGAPTLDAEARQVLLRALAALEEAGQAQLAAEARAAATSAAIDLPR
ncbi:MAG: protein kinase [Deltaproteobacteria bacterium]|nr:protein kinase [Deltaproteobacteria bacterium]